MICKLNGRGRGQRVGEREWGEGRMGEGGIACMQGEGDEGRMDWKAGGMGGGKDKYMKGYKLGLGDFSEAVNFNTKKQADLCSWMVAPSKDSSTSVCQTLIIIINYNYY